MTEILDGKAVAAGIRADVAERAAAFEAQYGRRPALAAVLVGDDPANAAYARTKARAAEKAGLAFHLLEMPASVGTYAVVARLRRLNRDVAVDGILVELPLPAGYDRRYIEETIAPAKDADGVTPVSAGKLAAGLAGPRPATAVAILELLERTGVQLAGLRATVVGRSMVVGKPTALLLLARDCTVTIAHSRTRDLVAVCREADILVAATGVPGLITAAHVKPGAIVVDAGTTMVGDGPKAQLVGDVAFAEVAPVAGAITPVPGGVGPVTTAVVLRTAVELAEARAGPD